jgi:uncharacterized protein YbaP (TraB family)
LRQRILAFSRLLAGLVAGALLACGPSLPSLPLSLPPLFEATPLVWRATASGGGITYLMGSVHLTREHIHSFGPVADAAWKASEELVVEVDVSLLTPQEMALLVARYGTIAPPGTLRSELSAKTWKQLSAYLESRSIAEEGVSSWKAWLVFMFVGQHEMRRAGFRTEQGVDRAFIEFAVAADRPITPLETSELQLKAFDNLPDPLAELLLEDSLNRVDGFAGEAEALIEAWRGGSEGDLASLLFQPLAEDPGLQAYYDLIFFERNRQMAARLDRLAGDGRTRFVVVGAGHMVGEQGIPRLLAERGWQVQRIGGAP